VVNEPAFVRSILPMFMVDEDLTIVVANQAAHRMLRVPDLRGRLITDFHTPESADLARRNAARLQAGLVNHNEREGRLISATGERLIVQIRVDPLLDGGDGRFRLVQMRDVTEIREHERALTAGERMYRDVVENLPNCTVLSFDSELRIQVVGGALIQRFGYDVNDVRGLPLHDVLPPVALTPMEDSIRAALRGEVTEMEYTSPHSDVRYRVQGSPIRSADGRIVGGFILSEDVSAERIRQAQLEQTQELSHVGTCRFDIRSGWDFDRKLLELLGVDTVEQALRAVDDMVVPADRRRTREAYRRVLAEGGRITLEYRVRHGRTGELRHVRAACDAVVNPGGELLRAVITHADVTEAVYSRRTAEAARAAVAQSRTVLLRRISDLLTTDRHSLAEKLERVTDVATAGLGDGAMLRIVREGGRGVESDTVAHLDPAVRELLVSVAARSEEPLEGFRGLVDLGPAPADAGGRRPLGTDAGAWADAHGIPRSPVLNEVIGQFIAAPVRHAGTVLGVLSVFRGGSDRPYAKEDHDLVQVLADHVGTAVGEGRAQAWAEQQRRERTVIAGRLLQLDAEQRELLDQLAEVEERERSLLAEAIHDDPMQLIIAVAMRLELLGMRSGEPDVLVDELIETLEAAVARLRTLITALTPPDLTDGLGPALRRLAHGIFTGTPTAVHCVGPDHVTLSTARKQTAYRILREALVNARKHARARNVDLALARDGSSVVITVTDDGVGADSVESSPGHLGMITMRARAAAEGCSLTVRSAPGRGTRVTLVVPADGPTAPVGG
jgi:PAS domain S-box-containing protein